MSRERAKKFNVPIFRTVADALTLGGDKLAVDGVLLIGEHGDYPTQRQGAEAVSALRDVPQDHGCVPPERAARFRSSTTSIFRGAGGRPSAWWRSRVS